MVKRFYLGLKRDTLQKSIYPLEGSVSIGRNPENDIALADYNVSRTHARVSFQKGSWIIEDLGSANGIIFSGERLVSKTLKAGDVFHIGASTFTFMQEGASDQAEQLSETMQMFSSLINYQSPFVDPNRTNPGSMRLQGALLSTPIFRSLGKKELRGLEDIANLHYFSALQLILREGDPGRSIYIILDGRVKVFTKDREGKEFLLATLEPYQFFREMALLTGNCLKEMLLVNFGVWPTESLPEEMINHSYKATSSDISLAGMKLVAMGPAMEAFREGCRLQLEIQLPNHHGRFETQGLVRHVTREKNRVKLGVVFVDTSTADKEKLQRFLYGQTQTIE